MADLKLPRLPDRTPVKLTINVAPELKRALDDYRLIYNEQYQAGEALSELVPHMLATFLAGDRGFNKAREALSKTGRGDG